LHFANFAILSFATFAWNNNTFNPASYSAKYQ